MIAQIMKKILLIGLVVILVLGMGIVGEAEEVKEEEKTETITKTITGEVSVITNNFIAVEYGLDSKKGVAFEMAFNIGKDIKIEHKRSLSEIGVGDTVTITYEEKFKKEKVTEKEEVRIINRVPKVIRFVRQAPQTPTEEAGVLQSREVEQ